MMSTSLQKVTGGASSPTFSNKLHNNFCINDTNHTLGYNCVSEYHNIVTDGLESGDELVKKFRGM